MLIYSLIFIPIIFIIFLYIKYKRKVVWWELSLQLVISLLIIVVVKLISSAIMTNSVEYYGSLVHEARYYEPWDEWITQYCTRTDDKGNVTTYDCSYRLYHSAAYYAYTLNYKNEVDAYSISEKKYKDIQKHFNNEKFVDLHRDYYRNDGDLYVTTWDKKIEDYYFFANTHNYSNKVKVAKSTYSFPKVTDEDKKIYKLYDYPKIVNYDVQTILGDTSAWVKQAEKKLKYLNGFLGPKKQIRLWILLYYNQPKIVANIQQNYWFGSNKNEYVICIGLDKEHTIKWNYIFTWSESQKLIFNTRNYLNDQIDKKLNLDSLSDFLYTEINDNWKRKEFKDFDYLTVEPTTTTLIIAFILQVIFNVLFGIWIVNNEFYKENKNAW